MKKIIGIKISPGIAIGPPFFFKRDQFPIPDYRIGPDEAEKEMERFQQAVRKATDELTHIRKLILEHLNEEHARMIDGQIMVLSDVEMLSSIRRLVVEENRNVVWAFFEVLSAYEKAMQGVPDYQRERLIDLRDIKKRIINHLSLDTTYLMPKLSEPAIYISDRISPTELIHIKDQGALGIITQFGGVDSHVGILARAFRLPYVSSVTDLEEMQCYKEIILDADNEEIVLCLPDEDRKPYDERARQYEIQNQKMLFAKLVKSSRDGIPFRILLNVSFVDELKAIRPQNIQGIGLFRTEFLCIERNSIPDEEEQFMAYKSTLQAMKGRPVTFRTFDFGRDKLIAMLDLEVMHRDEAFEDWGGIRFCLDNPDILITQLRAFLRASICGPAQLMLPMVSRIDDVLEVKSILNDVKNDLKRQGIKFKDKFSLGVMIETQMALEILEPLAEIVDFFSIGTNDLALYLIGARRDESLMKNYYNPIMFRAVDKIVQTAARFTIPVTVCGEMASDPYALLGLIAIGIRSISVNYSVYHVISNEIKKLRMKNIDKLAKQILNGSDAFIIYRILEEYYKNQVQ